MEDRVEQDEPTQTTADGLTRLATSIVELLGEQAIDSRLGAKLLKRLEKEAKLVDGIGAATAEQDSEARVARRAGRTRTRSASGRRKSVGIGERKTTLDGRIFRQKSQNEILKPGRLVPHETRAAQGLGLSGFIGQEVWRFFHYIDTNRLE